jgi:ABC-2 family transporter protein
MSTSTISGPAAGATKSAHDGDDPGGFGRLVLAEWTKFRTVKGWIIGMIVAGLLTVALGVLTAGGVNIGCQINGGPPKSGKACLPYIPHGPGGEVVTDSFYFAHQSLTGNGTITARITSLTGEHANLGNGPVQAGSNDMVPGLTAWSKAGIIIKDGTHQGSAYAAMMATGANGVRMQYNYTHDTAGIPGNVSAAHPRWLRLVRSGDTITGYDSADGVHWTMVGTATLSGLPSTVQIGLFATSPNYVVTSRSFGGGNGSRGGPSEATGVFDHVRLSGQTSGAWSGIAVGGGTPQNAGINGPGGGSAPGGPAPFTKNGGTFTVSGSGDIAPVVPGAATMLPTATIEQALVGVFLGLMVIVVVGAMFFTVEYRRGLIRTTFAATPRRGSVLAAKAVVAGLVAFVVGIVACVITLVIALPIISNEGNVLLPTSALTDVRVVAGTAAMLGVAAALAVAVGAVFRRSAAAITVVIVAVVMPYLLTVLNVFPPAVGDWLLRLTPAAGLAIEQSVPRYAQVITSYSANDGYYPLPPWAGFGVLCCWAAAALGLAVIVLRRRDA